MSAAKRKILIIDDEPVVVESVKASLVHEGYEVSGLQDGRGALEKIQALQPDLILLDLYMPEVGGWELCRKLKADPRTRSIPVVILSGSNEPVDVATGIDAGAVDYVKKPLDGVSLAAKIRARLGRR